MNEIYSIYRTDFLIPENSALIGIGSIFNICGEPYFEYYFSESSEEADARAIASDWGVVGNDLADSMIKYQDNIVSN